MARVGSVDRMLRALVGIVPLALCVAYTLLGIPSRPIACAPARR